MFSTRQPTEAGILRQIAAQAPCKFSYADPGITRDSTRLEKSTPYTVDHTRAPLGRGAAAYQAAIAALRSWKQFDLGWLSARPPNTPIEEGAVITVVANLFGIWSTNFARIVYAIDDARGPVHRFGFAYGTLPDHIEMGEERFLVEWDTRDDDVFYDVVAYSRPRHALAKWGYPFIRHMQKRFGRESAATMQRAMKSA